MGKIMDTNQLNIKPKEKRRLLRQSCVHASKLLPGQPLGGRDRTCALGLHGGTVQLLGVCQTCERHELPTITTAESVTNGSEPKKPCADCGKPNAKPCSGCK
jgi:hypothetical protein